MAEVSGFSGLAGGSRRRRSGSDSAVIESPSEPRKAIVTVCAPGLEAALGEVRAALARRLVEVAELGAVGLAADHGVAAVDPEHRRLGVAREHERRAPPRRRPAPVRRSSSDGRLGDHDLERAGRGEGLEHHVAVDEPHREGVGAVLGGALLLDGADERDDGDGAVVAGVDRGDEDVVGLGGRPGAVALGEVGHEALELVLRAEVRLRRLAHRRPRRVGVALADVVDPREHRLGRCVLARGGQRGDGAAGLRVAHQGLEGGVGRRVGGADGRCRGRSSRRVVPATATTTTAAAATTASTDVGGASEGGGTRASEGSARARAPAALVGVGAPSSDDAGAATSSTGGSGRAALGVEGGVEARPEVVLVGRDGSSWRAVRTTASGSTSRSELVPLTAPPPPGCGAARRGHGGGGRRRCRGRRPGSWRPRGGRSPRRRRARR